MNLENPNNAIGKIQIVRTASESRLFRYWISNSEISNGNITEISLYAEIDCVQPIIDINNTLKLMVMPNYIHTIHILKRIYIIYKPFFVYAQKDDRLNLSICRISH